MTLTHEISKLIHSTTYEDIPAKALEYAKLMSLSVTGATLAGSTEPAGKTIADLMQHLMETARELTQANRIEAADIDGIEVETNLLHGGLCRFDNPTTADEAKFSIPHGIAVAVLDDGVRLGSFRPAGLKTPRSALSGARSTSPSTPPGRRVTWRSRIRLLSSFVTAGRYVETLPGSAGTRQICRVATSSSRNSGRSVG